MRKVNNDRALCAVLYAPFEVWASAVGYQIEMKRNGREINLPDVYALAMRTGLPDGQGFEIVRHYSRKVDGLTLTQLRLTSEENQRVVSLAARLGTTKGNVILSLIADGLRRLPSETPDPGF